MSTYTVWPVTPDDMSLNRVVAMRPTSSGLIARLSGDRSSTSCAIVWKSRIADDESVRARVAELLEMGGLADKADRLVGELPHGDQRSTEIMMALALKPRLLLLDEPTAGMGDRETYDITTLIRSLHRDQKLAIVLIEHDMRVVFHLADRIMVLAEGAVLAEGTPGEIASNERVQEAYLGKAA